KSVALLRIEPLDRAAQFRACPSRGTTGLLTFVHLRSLLALATLLACPGPSVRSSRSHERPPAVVPDVHPRRTTSGYSERRGGENQARLWPSPSFFGGRRPHGISVAVSPGRGLLSLRFLRTRSYRHDSSTQFARRLHHRELRQDGLGRRG